MLSLPGSQGLKPSTPQCQCSNLKKAKVLWDILMLAPSIHSHALTLAFVTPCFCSVRSPGTARLSLPPRAAGWAFAFLLLPPQTAPPRQSLPPPLGRRRCSAAPCQAVPVQGAGCSTLSHFKVAAQSRGTVPTARSPEALLNVVICGWASATSHESLGKWSFWLGQMRRAGKQRRDGA